jgi:hypothetical protein
VSVILPSGARAEMPDRRKMDRTELRRFRDGLILKVKDELTLEEIAAVFNRHPVHISRIINRMPQQAKDRVRALT